MQANSRLDVGQRPLRHRLLSGHVAAISHRVTHDLDPHGLCERRTVGASDQSSGASPHPTPAGHRNFGPPPQRAGTSGRDQRIWAARLGSHQPRRSRACAWRLAMVERLDPIGWRGAGDDVCAVVVASALAGPFGTDLLFGAESGSTPEMGGGIERWLDVKTAPATRW